MAKHGYVLVALLGSILLEAAVAINRTDFFGEYIPQVTPHLIPNDDDSSLAIGLSVPYPFFDTPRSSIFVNNNGALTFSSAAPPYSQMVFPNNPHQLIAQYWADADTRGSGNVWFYETTDQVLLDRATSYIRRGFVNEKDFQPTHLFLATWDRVGYYNMESDKTNTFQCILATDSIELYVIFLYADIQWTTGSQQMGVDGLGGNPAQVGFNAGDMSNSYSVPGSRTDDIVNIDERSNIGERGVWVYHVSGPRVRSGGCSDRENSLTLSPSHGNILGGETVSVAGPCFDPNTQIQCEFDDITRSAIYVSQQEVLCITPQLRRSGTLTLRILVDGSFKAQGQFTSISVEKAHQVDVTTPSRRVTLSPESAIGLQWDPLTIFPRNSSSEFQVTIGMYTLNLENGDLRLIHRFTSNSPNDGQESVVIPSDLESLRNVKILPVLFLVSASVNPVSTAQSGTQYTNLVLSGQKAGRWSSQYYYINPSVTNRTAYHDCQAWYEGESENSAVQLLEESMPCPPRKEQARAPNSGLAEINYTSFYGNSLYRTQWLNTFHQDASTCFGSGDLRSSLFSSTQECCYDGSGHLVTGAPGGGSVHKTPLAKSRVGHFRDDTRPYLLCCAGFAPSCHKYYERRPSDNGSRYQPQRTAWIFGDPHLVTLDGFKYTFNGKGEFTLVGTQNNLLTVQGRMQQFGSRSATVLTAIAAKELYSDTVMVARSRRGIDAYLNGERVDLSVITRQEFRNVSVVRENNSIVTVEFSCGAHISVRAENDFLSAISVVLPPNFKGDDNTKGLLGIYNGNSSDDLKPQNALSSLARNSSTERIHNLFGLTWILSNSEQSLFTYLPYESFGDFHDPLFDPIFSVDSSTTNVSICDGDESCIFDVVATNDLRVGVATRDAVRQIEDTMQRSYPVVCEQTCLNGACVANNTCRCSAGYTGSRCDLVDSPLSCDVNPCASGERCAILAGSYVCTPGCSRDPTTSPLCGVLAAGHCIVNHCNNGGVCRPNNSISPYEFECICPSNYTGRLCDLARSVCTINPCLNGGACSESGDSDFTCSCRSGFSGKTCDIAEEGPNIAIIIIAVSCAVAAFLVVVVLAICIVVFCFRTRVKKGIIFESVESPSGSLKTSTLQKESTDGDHRHHNGTPTFSSREGSTTPANGVPPHNREQLPVNHYQEPGSTEHIYHQIEDPHDQTPPPPYPDDCAIPDLRHVRQHNNNSNRPPVELLQSDSNTINRIVYSGFDSTRSNTTSPDCSEHSGGSSSKGSIKRTESLHKSNRSLKTPSPSHGMYQSHSYSNQSIAVRSSASTPAGQYQTVKKNGSLTLPNSVNGRYLSSSTSQISKMRRHSSSNYRTYNIITDDRSMPATDV